MKRPIIPPPRSGPVLVRPAKPPAEPLWWPAQLTSDLRSTASATAKLYFLADPPDEAPSLSDQEKTVYLLGGADAYTVGGALDFMPAGTDVVLQYHPQHKRWYAFQPFHVQHVAFELIEELVQWSGVAVRAYLWAWSASAGAGAGGYVRTATEIRVADRRTIGYYGGVGAMGAAEMMPCVLSPYKIGVIYDLQCPSGYYYYPT